MASRPDRRPANCLSRTTSGTWDPSPATPGERPQDIPTDHSRRDRAMRTLARRSAILALAAATASAQNPKMIPAPSDVAAAPADAAKDALGPGLQGAQARHRQGPHPGRTDLVTVQYTGWTTDGKMFDSSVTRGEPATFPLDRVIAGWTEGVQLMVTGEIPPLLDSRSRSPTRAHVSRRACWCSTSSCSRSRPRRPRPPADVKAPPSDAKKTASGLAYKVVTAGTGAKHPTASNQVTVHYSGWTTDGKLFDSSVTRGAPATFPLDRRDPRVDRRRAADGRRRDDALLDSGEPRLQRPEPPVRHARVRRGTAEDPVTRLFLSTGVLLLGSGVPRRESDRRRRPARFRPGRPAGDALAPAGALRRERVPGVRPLRRAQKFAVTLAGIDRATGDERRRGRDRRGTRRPAPGVLLLPRRASGCRLRRGRQSYWPPALPSASRQAASPARRRRPARPRAR